MALDPDDLITNILPLLHASSTANLVAWTNTELKRSLSEHLKRLAQRFAIFVERDTTTITLATGTALYNLPENHLSTMHVAVSNRHLIADARHSLERRDSGYQATAATVASPVRRFYEDKQPIGQIGFYPVPSAAQGNGLLPELIYHAAPCDIEAGIETIKTVGDYLELKVLEDTYRRESDMSMPETAQACGFLASLYEAQFQHLYGMAQ